MRIAEIDFPPELIDALRDNTLVVFAGAGVSMGPPACLPDFKTLAATIASGTGQVPSKSESEDRFLGRLRQESGTDVHALAAQAIRRDDLKANELHFSLLRLFTRDQSVRLVTTNFDELFENAAKAEDLFDANPEVYGAPALPLGHNFRGIVHLHGAVSRPHDMVLTDGDFGRAYLTEGWARRFLVSLFRQFTVLFVGYSHSDTDMHYLARALPEREAKRFALVGSDDNGTQLWEARGIEPIAYPKPSGKDFSALDEGVRRLADTTRLGVVEWRNEIRKIARRPPPLGQEDIDKVEEALNDEVKIRFFTENAKSLEWINWLDQRKHLDALFKDGDLSNSHQHLVHWLGERVALGNSTALFLLLGKHNMRMHPELWHRLGWQVSNCNAARLSPDVLSQWVSALTDTLPTNNDHFHHVLASLGIRCASYGDYASLLNVFETLTASRLRIKRGFPLEDDRETPIDTSLQMVGVYEDLHRIWEQGFVPNLGKLVGPLLALVVARIEERHRTLRPWGRSDHRPAVESHGQNRGSSAPNVLIDVARDCLEWLAGNEESEAKQWLDRLTASETPLLQRIALHTVTEHPGMTPNEKIEWLVGTFNIHDTQYHHEVFCLAGKAYPKADEKHRMVLIAAVKQYSWQKDPSFGLNPEQLTAKQHLDWFDWLNRMAPNCPLAKQAYDDAFQRYPDFKPRELPDFLTWFSPLPETHPMVEELLARPAAGCLDELLTFQPMDRPHARLERARNVVLAAERSFEWGLAMAGALAEAGKWDAYPWSALMDAWSAMELSEDEYRSVLSWLGRSELRPNFAREMVKVLLSLVLNGGKPYAERLLPDANRIATGILRGADYNQFDEDVGDWLSKAMSHAAGKLALFWLCGFSVWRDAQNPTPRELNGDYRAALTGIARGRTLAGKLGRSVLVMEFHNLLEMDRLWTLEHVLPLFSPDSDDWDVAREGLARVFLTPDVADLLEGAFLEAAEWYGSKDSSQRNQFIARCIYMIAHFVENPLKAWLPTLFNRGGKDFRASFTSNLYEEFLREMDEATQREWWQRWLKQYWENRLDGVPAALSRKEIAQMIRWPAHLSAVFPEAVALAVKMNSFPLQSSLAIYDLAESNLPQRYPEAVAQLMLHLEKYDLQGAWSQARELTSSLLEASIPEDLKHRLRELRARKGIEE